TTSHQTGNRAAPIAFARQPDGSTLIAFNPTLLSAGVPPVAYNLGRLLSNGSLDPNFNPFPSFSSGGPFTSDFIATGLAPLPDGTFFVFGLQLNSGNTIYGRLLADGTADTSYPGGSADFNNAFAQPDNQV